MDLIFYILASTAPGSSYDFALVKVAGTVTLTSEVNTICLPSPGTIGYGQSCDVAGWGRTHQDTSETPQFISIHPNITSENCP